MQELIRLALPLLSDSQKRLIVELNNGFVAVGGALPPDMQLFISENWKTLGKFLESEEGKMALQQFVNDWKMK